MQMHICIALIIIIQLVSPVGSSKESYIFLTDASKSRFSHVTRKDVEFIYVSKSAGIHDLLGSYPKFATNKTLVVHLNNDFARKTLKDILHADGKPIENVEHGETNLPAHKHYHFHSVKYHKRIETNIFNKVRHKHHIGVITFTNCLSSDVNHIGKYFQEMEISFSCVAMFDDNGYFYELPFVLNMFELRWKVSHAIIILPWHLLEIVLQEMTRSRFYGMIVIIKDLSDHLCRNVNENYPHLEIYNMLPDSTKSTPDKNEIFVVGRKTSKESDDAFRRLLAELFLQNTTYGFGSLHDGHDMRRKIRIATVLYPPYVYSRDIDMLKFGHCQTGIRCFHQNTGKYTCCSGMVIEYFEKIANDLGLSYDMHIRADGYFGWITSNGTWNGLISEVSSHKADIAVQVIAAAREREAVVDYTYRFIPSAFSRLIVTIKNPKSYNFVNFLFLYHMSDSLIIYVPLITIGVLVLVFCLENIGFKLHYNIPYHARESFSYINGILYQRDLGAVTPHRFPARCVSIIFALAMTVLVSAYTAQLTAANIFVEYDDQLQGLNDEKFRQKSFIVGVHEATESSLLLSRLFKLKRLGRKPRYVSSTKEGIERVFNKSLDAFVGSSIGGLQRDLASDKKYCKKLHVTFDNNFIQEFHFIVPKKSALGPLLSESIQRLTEYGELKYIARKWNETKLCKDYPKEFSDFSVKYFGGLIVLLCGTVVISIMILFIETLYEKWRAQRVYSINEAPTEVPTEVG